nr:ribonuclease H-like domain-containing protein [Tanacetum cinerariifolium]
MRIEQYFVMTDYSLWEVILNGDSPVLTRVIEGVVQPVAPTTAEQRLARKNELKAHGTLLMALPDKHKLKFNIHKDAKTLMEAIKKRFGGNKETKKRNKIDLEEQSLDDLFNSLKIYEAEVKSSSSASTSTQNIAFVSSQNTNSTNEPVSAVASVSAASVKIPVSPLPYVDTLSNARIRRNLRANGPTSMGFDMSKVECYNCHKKRHFARECSYDWSFQAEEEPTNYALMAFTSSSSSSSDNKVVSCSKACIKAYATLQSPYDKLIDDFRKSQFDVISYKTGLESIEARLLVYQQNEIVFEKVIKLLKLEVQLRDNALVVLRQNFEKEEQERGDLKLKLEKFQTSSKNLSHLLASQANNKTKLGYNTQVFTSSMFDCDEMFTSETDDSLCASPIYNRYHLGDGYHDVPPPYTGTFMPPKPDLVFNDAPNVNETVHTAFNVELSPFKLDKELSHRPSAPIIEDWVSDSEDDLEAELPHNAPSFVHPTEQVKPPRPSVKPVETSIPADNHKTTIPKPKSQGSSKNRKACFVCKSLTYLIKDYDYYEKNMAQTPARNHAQRGNHQHYARMTLPNPQRHMVPTVVLTKSKLVPITVARPVTAVIPKPHVTSPRQAKTVVTKPHSPPRRHIHHSPSPKASNFSPKVTSVKVPHVNVVKGVKRNWGNPQHALKDKGVIDSGYSRHMTGNMSYLSDFEEINSGYVAFGGNPKGDKISGKGKIRTGKLDFDDIYFVKELKFNLFSFSQMCDKKNSVLFTDTECIILSPEFKLLDEDQVLLRVPRKNKMYNVDLKNIVPSGDLTCIFAKATLDESNLWHRRLGHISFKTMNKLVQGNLVRGLPSKVFENNHTCVACKKGKQHRASCKTKPNRVLVTKPHNKTLYELLLGRTPSIDFMRPFGYPVTILNTLDPLGKFDAKVDEGFLVGYSVSSKSFRVFNSRTRIVQDTLHINFLENKPNVAGSGPTWLFDIDTLTKTMNYQPVTAAINLTLVQNTDGDAAFEVKEPEFEGRKPESEVYVSLSSSAQTKKHDDKTKREAKDKIPAVGQISTNNTNTFSAAGPSNTVVSPTHGKSSYGDTFQYPDDPNMPELEDNPYSDDEEDVGVEANFTNLETSITVSPILTTRVHKDHHVVSAAKLPILNPNEFDLWKMRIEQYFLMTDYSLWEVILNDDSPIPTRVVDGVVQPVAPTTAEQVLAKKNELKAQGTLLMALPYKHAKSLMEAIEKRFGGNKETKKVQKTLLKQQYKNFTGLSYESLDQIHDRLQKLISQMEILGESLSQKDINLKFLRILPTEWRTHTLIWRNKTDLEDQSLDDLFNSLNIYESNSPQLDNADLKQIDADDLEEMDLKWHMAMLTMRARRRGHFARECRDFRRMNNQQTMPSWHSPPQDLPVLIMRKSQFNVISYKTGLESVKARIVVYQQNENVFEEDIKLLKLDVMLRDNALVDLRKKFKKDEQERDELKLKLENFQTSSKNPMFDSDELISSESDVSMPTSLVYGRFKSREEYHAIPPPYTGTFMPPKLDFVFYDAPTVNETVPTILHVEPSTTKPNKDLSQSNRHSTPIIEDWVSDSEDESESEHMPTQKAPSFIHTPKHVKNPRPSVKPVKHPIPAENLRKDIPKKHAMRGNHHHYERMTHPHPHRHVVPTAVLTRSRLVPLNAAKPVTTIIPQTKVQHQRPTKHDVTKVHSPIRRPINLRPSPTHSNFHQKGTTVKATQVNVVQGVKGNWVLVTKPHNKTPYELLLGRTPSIGFMRPFGCPVTILRTLDPLGSGPTWLFDIDTLTQSMNYQPVVTGNQPNSSADPQNTNVDTTFEVKEPESKVHVSPSSSAKTKKHVDKNKREAKRKSLVELSTGVNDVPRLQAPVDRKKVIITEATIREALRLDDAKSIDCLSNEEIFTELSRMRPLFEGMIVAQQDDDVTDEGDVSVAVDDVPAAADEPTIPSPTPTTQPPPPSQELPSTSQVHSTPPPSPIAQPPSPQQQPQPSHDAKISMNLFHTLLETCTTLTKKVEHLEQDKIAQTLKIKKLKQRVKKLERRNKLKVYKLRRLKKVGAAQKVDTSEDTVIDDVSKQGGIIANIDADEDVTLKDVAVVAKDVVAVEKDAEIKKNADVQGRQAESQAQIYQINLENADKVLSIQDDEVEPAELQEVIEVVTTAKLMTEVVTAASATITVAATLITAATLTVAPSVARRRKGVVIRDPEETATPSIIIHSEPKSKDKGKGIMVEEPKPLKKQAHIELDEAYA